MTAGGLYGDAVTAAEDLLRGVYRLEVSKALDPLDKHDFLVIVQRLARALRGASGAAEAGALRRALDTLDVDWTKLTATARERVIRAAHHAMRDVAAQVLPRVDQIFEVEANRVVGSSRRSTARQFGLRLGASTSRTDARIAAFIRTSQGHFIRDEYGRRRDDLCEHARGIVAAGLEQGLGRDDIVRKLSADMATAAIGRGKAYWDTIAMSFANRGRTYTQLAAFDEAGVERFRFDAVLDESTSHQCRFMHGRVFSVGRAMQLFDEVEQASEPEHIKNLQPWVQVGADDAGNQVLYYQRAGRRHVVAQVDEGAVGQADRVGRYSRALTADQLEAAGVSTPPIHGRCRSVLTLEAL